MQFNSWQGVEQTGISFELKIKRDFQYTCKLNVDLDFESSAGSVGFLLLL